MFRIEMLPAQHGDCLWIEYGTVDSPYRILIDTGPLPTWKVLRSRLEKVPKGQRKFELFVLTHVDSDHIEAAVKLLNVKQLDFEINDVWFNGWQHIKKQRPDMLGAVQGEYFSGLIEKHKIQWNEAFNGGPVMVPEDGKLPSFTLPGDMKLTLLSPDINSIKQLAVVWEKAVVAAGLEPGDREGALRDLKEQKKYSPADQLGGSSRDIDALAGKKFNSDDSVTNGSSIAFLAEYDDKKALFFGDGHAPILVNGIERLLAERGINRLSVDAVKLPHHASKNNTNKELIRLIKSPRYLISTNGAQFHHPDAEAIARVISCSGGNTQLCFNYLSDTTQMWEKPSQYSQSDFRVMFPADGIAGLTLDL